MTEQLFHRVLKASLVCCLAVILTGCEELFNILDNPIQTSLNMATSDVKLGVGEQKQRQATCVSPATIVYASSNATVATVDANGVVTGVAAGEATITASVAAIDYWTAASVSYKVIVKPVIVYATSLALNEATLRVGIANLAAQTFTTTVTPSDAAITWTSSDETIATVDATGKVTPIKAGKVTITATSGDLSATSNVYVYDKIHNINTDGDANVTSGEWLIEGNGTAIANSITIADGASVVLNGINITSQISCSGNATIILADGSTNTVNVYAMEKAGIQIGGDGKTLTINAETAGTGKLTAKGGLQAAGIGTGNSPSSAGGNITINGGKVTATGGGFSAGIGTGDACTDNNTCGAITINGGTVTATGGDLAAGIGTGLVQNNKINTCGAITINGGTVTATAGAYNAGIGTGYAYAVDGNATAVCGNITINGGTVNATGASDGAGIGTGRSIAEIGYTASQTCGAITIGTGVTSVIATKGSGAPNSIGVGKKAEAGGTENQTCGTITIGGDATTYAAGVAASPFTYPTAP